MISVTQSITKAGKKENGLLLYNLSKDNIATNDKFLSRLYSSVSIVFICVTSYTTSFILIIFLCIIRHFFG